MRRLSRGAISAAALISVLAGGGCQLIDELVYRPEAESPEVLSGEEFLPFGGPYVFRIAGDPARGAGVLDVETAALRHYCDVPRLVLASTVYGNTVDVRIHGLARGSATVCLAAADACRYAVGAQVPFPLDGDRYTLRIATGNGLAVFSVDIHGTVAIARRRSSVGNPAVAARASGFDLLAPIRPTVCCPDGARPLFAYYTAWETCTP